MKFDNRQFSHFCMFAGLFFATADAEATCASTLKKQTAPDGTTVYSTSLDYGRSLDTRRALENFRKVAAAEEYMILGDPDFTSATPSFGIARPPAKAPILITANEQSGLVTVATMISVGELTDPKEIEASLCDLAGGFQVDQPTRFAQAGSAQTPAQSTDDSRTTLPVAKPKTNILSPSVEFDEESAKKALQPGGSIITGQACAAWKGNIIYAAGQKVYLYPATPYWEQFVALSKKSKPGRDEVVPLEAALRTRMEATANELGQFQFSKMKPGRYFLITSVSAVLGGTRDVYAGQVSNGYATANVYRAQDYSFDSASEMTKYVDVKSDGDTVKVTLQPPITANPFHKGMAGALFGCTKLPGS